MDLDPPGWDGTNGWFRRAKATKRRAIGRRLAGRLGRYSWRERVGRARVERRRREKRAATATATAAAEEKKEKKEGKGEAERVREGEKTMERTGARVFRAYMLSWVSTSEEYDGGDVSLNI